MDSDEFQIDYVRYLRSKKTVDDRALNHRVLTQLESLIKSRAQQLSIIADGDRVKVQPCAAGRCHPRNFETTPKHVFQVLEIGCGVGAMAERLLKNGFFSCCEATRYVFADTKASNLQAAIACMNDVFSITSKWSLISQETIGEEAYDSFFNTAHAAGVNSVHNAVIQTRNQAAPVSNLGHAHFHAHETHQDIYLDFVCMDFIEYARSNPNRFDLVIAAAFLDLVDIPKTLPIIFSALCAGGTYYFPINFDGTTHFSPIIEAALDLSVEQAFHEEMDKPSPDGAIVSQSHAGRNLAQYIPAAGGGIDSWGSSSWTVAARNGNPTDSDSSYEGDEAYFLLCIIQFIQDTVVASNNLDQEKVKQCVTND
mmetsp:Transcript_21520/g.37026  ORF Transcript_21520/g.37026 Transcript_21520/m.37026 type:complete len:367 (-) Transcript_21520:1826-2926(-)